MILLSWRIKYVLSSFSLSQQMKPYNIETCCKIKLEAPTAMFASFAAYANAEVRLRFRAIEAAC